jgi:serine-threonine kinase receptor-associated protein
MSTEQKEQRQRIDGPIVCPGHSRPVPDLAFSSVTDEGYFLVSSCLDGKAMLREGVSGDWIGTFLGHKGAVWSARLNADATKCVTASADFSVKLWNAVSGDEVHTFPHKHIVKTAEFSKDCKTLYTGGQEKKLRMYDLNKPEAGPQITEALGQGTTISRIVCLPDENLLLSYTSEDKGIRVWDRRTFETVKTLETDAAVTSMSITLDGSVVTSTAGKVAQFWDSSSLEVIKSHTMERTLNCISYDKAGERFVTGSSTELWVRGYEFESGKEIVCNKGHHGPVRSLAVNPSGSSYASGSEDGTLRIWDWPGKKAEK